MARARSRPAMKACTTCSMRSVGCGFRAPRRRSTAAITGRCARADEGGARGATRDALTLFDESGVLVVSSSPEFLRLLRAFEWKALFVQRREEIASSLRVYVFGHSILEKALSPYKGLTGKAMLFQVEREFFDLPADAQLRELDRRVEGDVDSLSESPSFAPLPLLGIPGWCADNQDPAYYDDTSQFRPGRAVRKP